MQSRTDLLRAALVAALIVCASAPPARAGVADDLCTGDPCVISGSHELQDSLGRIAIDFGNRAVVLTGSLEIGPNEVLLSARTFEISDEISGAASVDRDTGSVEMVADNITFQDGSMVLLRASACTAGDFDGGGTVTVDEIVGALNLALDGCPI